MFFANTNDITNAPIVLSRPTVIWIDVIGWEETDDAISEAANQAIEKLDEYSETILIWLFVNILLR